ncbi:NmrA family NAD(P)-binding protein [Actinomadura fibrosa]|uniref:NmrA family NAD(P)-binding protein n=1 Tax=Actinomadura fibrosa TaxID=111802 RepID=A0ABW2XV76_9ACTN|nr:NmrA family NAD(P)-binding protein [Actinomadura fibrosa]
MILVTGATGSIGTHLVRFLLDDGVPFRALVRDPAQGEALGCDHVVGDFDDPGSLAAAMRGVDRLFLNAAGAQPVTEGEQPMIRQQRAAIDAARAAGVARVVKVSVWHAHQGGRLAEGAHWEIEQYLKASGLGWTILQPSGFMQNFITGAGTFTAEGGLLGAYGDAGVSYIDCQDIAACAAALLSGTAGLGETYVLTGPQALTHTEIAREISTVLGRSVAHLETSPDELAATLRAQGLPAGFADDLAELCREVAAGSLEATTSAVRELTGREPRTFARFLADNADALRASLLTATR